MARRERKYNVWIAYSDLFTNLSTFLFISALGVFAAFGSGLNAPPGVGATLPCSVPGGVAQEIVAGDSMLRRVERPQQDAYPCKQYFVVNGNRYPTYEAAFARFGDKTPMRTQDAWDRICLPLYKSLARKDFISQMGELTVIGIVSKEQAWKNQPNCSLDNAPAVAIFGKRNSLNVINQCLDNPLSYPDFCTQVRDCVAGKPPLSATAACDEIITARSWEAGQLRQCMAVPAREQAKSLVAECTKYRQHRSFPIKLLRDARTMDAQAETRDLLRDVRSDAIVTSASQSQALPGLEALPTGSIVVEIAFRR